MKKSTGLTVGFLLSAMMSSAAIAENKNETLCTHLQQTGALSIAACSDPSLKMAALHYIQARYALEAQDSAKNHTAIGKQLAENDAILRHDCALPPVNPTAAPLSEQEKTCYIDVRQQQTTALSHSLREPYTQEITRPIALHTALQQKLIDGGYLYRSPPIADGIYDHDTRNAIKKWQAAYGDDKTGVITNDEIPHLQKLGLATFGMERKNRRSDVSFISFPQPLVSSGKGPALTRIFQMDMLEIDRGYLERITGPAKYIGERSDKLTTLTYMVDDCEVTAYAAGDTIKGYNLHVTPNCTIPLGGNTSDNHPTLSLADMTLGEFNTIFQGNNQPIGLCFAGACGNSIDSSLGIVSYGAHYNDEVNFSATAANEDMNSDKATAAAEQWTSAMIGPDDNDAKRDYVEEGKFNCDGKYDEAGIRAMKNVPIQYFFFGRMEPDIALELNAPPSPACTK